MCNFLRQFDQPFDSLDSSMQMALGSIEKYNLYPESNVAWDSGHSFIDEPGAPSAWSYLYYQMADVKFVEVSYTLK